MKPKWERGGAIDDVDMALSMIARGDPIYERHKLQTAGWTQGWPIRHVMNSVTRRALFIALPADRNPPQ
ncbi:hypothetical protein [Mesorhizobium amorphae]|uniref:hypothetical protein n=1 Tax=Mesorhizobium amorphae TaxID=71433 RepID=UPI0011864E8A|nr:hypothetical protein [Mesorhizobium amorphae]